MIANETMAGAIGGRLSASGWLGEVKGAVGLGEAIGC